jgi:hypothetical protein
MTAVKSQVGYVGFFDILGYKQVILNNQINATAKLISDILMKMPDTVVTNITRSDAPAVHEMTGTAMAAMQAWNKILRESIHWLIFSDTILVSMALDRSLHPLLQFQRSGAFFQTCIVLLREMFDRGLPLRGAVSFGDFFIQERCFAGVSIVDAYQLSESLELSGAVLTREAAAMCRETREFAAQHDYDNMVDIMDHMFVEYLVPMKRDVNRRHLTLNWVNLDIGLEAIEKNVRDYVIDSFVSHNKSTPPTVYPKIHNTEMYIRYVQANVPPTQLLWMTPKVQSDVEALNLLAKTQAM